MLYARCTEVVLIGAVLLVAGCKDLVGKQSAQAGVADPNTYENAKGTLLKAAGVRGAFSTAANQVVLNSGAITDELEALRTTTVSEGNQIDARQLPETQGSSGQEMYNALQQLRVSAALTVIAMRRDFPNSLADVRGEMFALQGYAEILLADVFCSGVPLSMPRADADIDYEPGISRDSLYQHAVGLFDSATVLATDSENIATLAKVGRGRALLALGRFSDAASAVNGIATESRYTLNAILGHGQINRQIDSTDFFPLSASDDEAGRGLAYRTSGDPRTVSIPVSVCLTFDTFGTSCLTYATIYYPTKYPQSLADSTMFTVADGTEARLIEAEAALHAGQVSSWLSILNTLRTTIPELSALADPGASLAGVAATNARVDTLFAERAAWLYLTGHRQGDLRRLLRQYGRGTGWPSGQYPGIGSYGSAVNFAIPTTERVNHSYHGCKDRAP